MIARWSGSDRRQHTRRSLVKPASVFLQNRAEAITVKSVDVSEGGVRFMAPESAEVGEHLRFSFHGEEAREATVLGCIFLDEGFCIRCSFGDLQC